MHIHTHTFFESRASRIVSTLEDFGLVENLTPARRSRLALTDRGLAVLAHRDRVSLPIARTRWSAEPIDTNATLDWRNVSGSRSRQLLRNVQHTGDVHAFVAAFTEQARTLGWEIAQLDPPRRASRYFRHEGSLRSVQPDAFAILRKGGTKWPFFLEWERRAVRPATMAARIAIIKSLRPTILPGHSDMGGSPLCAYRAKSGGSTSWPGLA